LYLVLQVRIPDSFLKPLVGATTEDV
jgi:hypothetical protein